MRSPILRPLIGFYVAFSAAAAYLDGQMRVLLRSPRFFNNLADAQLAL